MKSPAGQVARPESGPVYKIPFDTPEPDA